jgi:hypothetical protein
MGSPGFQREKSIKGKVLGGTAGALGCVGVSSWGMVLAQKLLEKIGWRDASHTRFAPRTMLRFFHAAHHACMASSIPWCRSRRQLAVRMPLSTDT